VTVGLFIPNVSGLTVVWKGDAPLWRIAFFMGYPRVHTGVPISTSDPGFAKFEQNAA